MNEEWRKGSKVHYHSSVFIQSFNPAAPWNQGQLFPKLLMVLHSQMFGFLGISAPSIQKQVFTKG